MCLLHICLSACLSGTGPPSVSLFWACLWPEALWLVHLVNTVGWGLDGANLWSGPGMDQRGRDKGDTGGSGGEEMKGQIPFLNVA